MHGAPYDSEVRSSVPFKRLLLSRLVKAALQRRALICFICECFPAAHMCNARVVLSVSQSGVNTSTSIRRVTPACYLRRNGACSVYSASEAQGRLIIVVTGTLSLPHLYLREFDLRSAVAFHCSQTWRKHFESTFNFSLV